MKYCFNGGWRFRFTKSAQSTETDGGITSSESVFPVFKILTDCDFYPISLPHTFQLPYYGEGEFFVGEGEYRKTFTLPEPTQNKLIFLSFEGAFQHAKIRLNGHDVAEHFGGYTAFDADLTPYLLTGENLLEITVDNFWREDLPPRGGEHVFCGGIYRDVTLVIIPKNHLVQKSIFVRTTRIDLEQRNAEISVSYQVENPVGENLTFRLFRGDYEIADYVTPDTGRELAFVIDNADFWSPETPSLYTLQIECGEERDMVEFGVREVRFNTDRGMFLNGKHYLLEGVNAHQDHGGWGDAVTRAGIQRDVAIIKEAGFNFIRGSHYPKHPEFAKACDRAGIFFLSEAPFWGIGGYSPDGYWDAAAMPSSPEAQEVFSARCLDAVEAMILSVRNSPSLLFWSLGNEIFFTPPDTLPAAKDLVLKMYARAKELDPDRYVGLGGVQRGNLHTLTDVAGFNGDGATLFRHVSVPNLVCEYGSVPDDRPGTPELRYGAGTKNTPEWRLGRALWCMFHHGSIANLGNLGIVDLYRLPLASYYTYRKRLRGIDAPPAATAGAPACILLTTDKRIIGTEGLDDCMITAAYTDRAGNRIISNRPITLTVTEGGGFFPTGASWVMKNENKTLADGCGAIEMRAFCSGKIAVVAAAEGLSETIIEITAIGKDYEAVRYPTTPPSLKPKKEKTDVLKNRPSTVSSECGGHTRDMSNDDNQDTYWSPEGTDNDVYVTFDTEGTRRIDCLNVNFGNVKLHITVHFSPDGSTWKKVYGNLFAKRFQNVKIPCKAVCDARYVKISFSSPGVEVHRVEAFEV